MIKLFGILLLTALVGFTTIQKSSRNDITLKILNKNVKDNSFMVLEITNHSKKNYYLPIINTEFSEKLSFRLPGEECDFFFLSKTILDVNENSMSWLTNDCNSENDELTLSENWNYKRLKLTIKDLILLKSNKSVRVIVPFHAVVYLTDYCHWSFVNDAMDKSICLMYMKHSEELVKKYLSKELIKSLKKNGYILYEKPITSNKIPLQLKNN